MTGADVTKKSEPRGYGNCCYSYKWALSFTALLITAEKSLNPPSPKG